MSYHCRAMAHDAALLLMLFLLGGNLGDAEVMWLVLHTLNLASEAQPLLAYEMRAEAALGALHILDLFRYVAGAFDGDGHVGLSQALLPGTLMMRAKVCGCHHT